MRGEQRNTRGSKASARRRKKKINEALGKIIPVFVALALIVVLVGVFYGNKLINKYKYSGKYADLGEYFDIVYDYQVAMIVNNEKLDEKAVYYKDTYYLSQKEVTELFTDRFYVDTDEQIALFTTQDTVIKADLNQSENFCYYYGDEARSLESAPVVTNDGQTYFSMEYLQLFADFDMQIFDNPKRMVIYTEDTSLTTATIKKDTKVRYRGGVKSDILEDMTEGDTVYVLEEMEDWAKVQTKDGIIGYVEMKRYDKGSGESISIHRAEIKPEFNSIAFDGKINMAFHQVFAKSASDFSSDVPTDKGINVVAPTWFRITNTEGDISDFASEKYVSNAHNAGVKVWAVWTDVDNTDVDMSDMFATTEKRHRLISTMINTTTQYGIDGINLDMERIPSSAGDDWAQFLKELSIETHKAGIVLSVCNYAPTESTKHFHREVQGEVCDFVIVMGYDEHWASGGVAGSVASINFVENGIVNTVAAGVPENKIINAIPFYTRVWKTKDAEVTAETLGMGKAATWCNDVGMELNWSDECCQRYGEKEMNNTLYQIWLEDNDSIKAKLSVMSAHNCAGVAEWKLGLEDSSVWDVIIEYLNS